MKNGWFVFFSLFVFMACDEGKVDTKAFAEELKDRKILHITQGEISTMAQKSGKILTDTLAVLIEDCFKQGNTSCCEPTAFEMVKSFNEDFDAEVKFISIADSSNLSGLEKEVFEAYLYLLANKLPMEANVQNLKNGYWLYSYPVIDKKLNCNPSSDSPFAGVWNIKMSQKLLIRNIGK